MVTLPWIRLGLWAARPVLAGSRQVRLTHLRPRYRTLWWPGLNRGSMKQRTLLRRRLIRRLRLVLAPALLGPQVGHAFATGLFYPRTMLIEQFGGISMLPGNVGCEIGIGRKVGWIGRLLRSPMSLRKPCLILTLTGAPVRVLRIWLASVRLMVVLREFPRKLWCLRRPRSMLVKRGAAEGPSCLALKLMLLQVMCRAGLTALLCLTSVSWIVGLWV